MNYYCTWRYMEWIPHHCDEEGLSVRDIMCEKFLFGEDGIAVKMHPESRDKLILLLDDGWDVESSLNGARGEDEFLRPYLGCCQISEEKFPGYGDTPEERLKTMVNRVKALGWRGLGIWISPTISYGGDVVGCDLDFMNFWKLRLEWSKYAEIAYWKVDWGSHDISDKHKKQLMQEKNRIYPALMIENAFVRPPINQKGEESAFSLAAHRYRLSYSDVLRIYDTTFPMSLPTTLSRVAALLEYPPTMEPGALGLINAEDELYVCAALGLSMGIMRYDMGGVELTGGGNESYGGTGPFPATRPARKQLDEVIRAVNWQEIAPAFSIAQGNSIVSKQRNIDRWKFTNDQTWNQSYCDKEFLEQRAPRIIARNTSLPVITSQYGDAEYPYIAASRNPNGALSIASFGRVAVDRGYYTCAADVLWDVGDLSGPAGIFGTFNSLELKFNQDLSGKRVYAGDLKDGVLHDITEEAAIDKNSVRLSKALIGKYSFMAKSEDFSEGGMLLQIGEAKDYAQAVTPKAKSIASPRYHLTKLSLAITARVHLANNQRTRRKNLEKYK